MLTILTVSFFIVSLFYFFFCLALSHVIEASYTGPTRTENEICDAYRFLSADDDIWHKKVDDNHFLLIFSSFEKGNF